MDGPIGSASMCLPVPVVMSRPVPVVMSRPVPLQERMPLAVVGSNVVIEVNGRKVRGRQYPWGVAEGRLNRRGTVAFDWWAGAVVFSGVVVENASY